MRRVLISAASALALLAASTATAEPGKPDRPDKPVTQKEPTATDVVGTPASDLNIKRDEIPPLLVAAQERPYVLRGLGTCRQLAAAIGELDGVLGEDIDVPQSEGRRTSPGRVAQSVVGSFIPFRGLIREISGARAHERRVRDAIVGDMMRRAFLKGLGQQKGCRYPGRPARTDEAKQIKAGMEAADRAAVERKEIEKRTRKTERDRKEGDGPQFVSQPVVQPLK